MSNADFIIQLIDEYIKLVDEGVKLVGNLAWPVVIVLLLYTQKKAVGSLLAKLQSFELPGGIKGTFKQDVEDATAASKQAADEPPPTTTEHPAIPLPVEPRDEVPPIVIQQLLEERWTRPSLIIEHAWIDVTSRLVELLRIRGLTWNSSANTPLALITLAGPQLSSSMQTAIAKLFSARNQVVSNRDFEPPLEEAQAFEVSAKRIAKQLDAYIAVGRPGSH